MQTIGAQIDELFALKQQKKQLEADISVLQKDIDAAESALLERMDREDTTKGLRPWSRPGRWSRRR